MTLCDFWGLIIKDNGAPVSLLLITCFRESHLPCHEDTQVVLWRDTLVKEPRPLLITVMWMSRMGKWTFQPCQAFRQPFDFSIMEDTVPELTREDAPKFHVHNKRQVIMPVDVITTALLTCNYIPHNLLNWNVQLSGSQYI